VTESVSQRSSRPAIYNHPGGVGNDTGLRKRPEIL